MENATSTDRDPTDRYAEPDGSAGVLSEFERGISRLDTAVRSLEERIAVVLSPEAAVAEAGRIEVQPHNRARQQARDLHALVDRLNEIVERVDL